MANAAFKYQSEIDVLINESLSEPIFFQYNSI